MADFTSGDLTVVHFSPMNAVPLVLIATVIPLLACSGQKCTAGAVRKPTSVTQESTDWSSAIVTTLKANQTKKKLDRKVRSPPGFLIALYELEAITVSCLLGHIPAEFEGVTNPELGLCYQVTLRALSLSVGTDG